ncbi:MAG: M48 family metalloprotease [Bacteroidales bacterium]
MNRIAILVTSFLLLVATGASGQIAVNISARNRSTGEPVTINTVARPEGRLVMQTAPDPATGQRLILSYADLRKYEFIPGTIESLWQFKMLESKVYDGLLGSGYHYDRRYAMEEKMKEFLATAEQNGSFYIDSYLESRLYGILRMVYPVRHTDRRPGVLSLLILSDITPDAWVGPDGTMVITTGMITALNSELELMALMAQEVAHFALDHHMTNYSNLLLTGTGLALGNVIRYSLQQELKADQCAVSVLEGYGESPAALGSMLRKVLAYGEQMGNYYLGSTMGFFPDAASRAAAYPDTLIYLSADYERLIAPVISFNAVSAYNQSQYLLCRLLLERNIASGQASADDLVILSQAMMRLSGSDDEDEKALSVVRSVTGRSQEAPPGAFKQEALLLLRLERRSEAEIALAKYEEALGREEQQYASIAGDWSQMISYLASEKEWVKRTRRR